VASRAGNRKTGKPTASFVSLVLYTASPLAKEELSKSSDCGLLTSGYFAMVKDERNDQYTRELK